MRNAASTPIVTAPLNVRYAPYSKTIAIVTLPISLMPGMNRPTSRNARMFASR